MKKIIAVLLLLALSIPLTANCVFADENTELSDAEREEIIETVKKGWYIYETVAGMADDATSPDRTGKSTPYIKDFIDVDADLYGHWEKPYGYQVKTLFKTKEELKNYVDDHFIGNTYNTESDTAYQGKRANIFDGYVYLPTVFGLPIWSLEWDFEHCEIQPNGNTATVILRLTDEYIDCEDNRNYSRNVKLIKTEDGWKIYGGTLFQGNLYVDLEGYSSDDRWYMSIYSSSPSTGENTVLYIAIAAAALAAMTALVVRRKRKIVLQ